MSELIKTCVGSTRSHIGYYTQPLYPSVTRVTTNMAASYSSKSGSAITQSRLRSRPFCIHIAQGGSTDLSEYNEYDIYSSSYLDYIREPVEWTDISGLTAVHHYKISLSKNLVYDNALTEWTDKVNKYGLPKYGCVFYEVETEYDPSIFTLNDYTPVSWEIHPNVYNWEPIEIPEGITHLYGDIASIDLQNIFETYFINNVGAYRNSNNEHIPPKVIISCKYGLLESIRTKAEAFQAYLSEKGILSEFMESPAWITACARGTNVDYPTGPV